ncbi:hypothetical protein PVAG01_06208 [Phlyctema vagabunda]|uniref:Uncharacterized protein n=1 Tax=Phlyctema vagabunda TaxID=108571 RepID=A0ABR4PFE1_9HELO
MTSKAAKKAHREANRLPKISRAEQRRLEQEEREAQRKEYERERAAAKAKAAREKKADKAAAERAARKKAGLPEPSKHVRPSQPTISMFVKTGAKRSWEQMSDGGEDVTSEDCPDEEGNEDDTAGGSVALAVETEPRHLEEHTFEREVIEPTNAEDPRASLEQVIAEEISDDAAIAQPMTQPRDTEREPELPESEDDVEHEEAVRIADKVAINDSDDEFGDFPCLSQSDLPRMFEEVNRPAQKESENHGPNLLSKDGNCSTKDCNGQDLASKAIHVEEDDEFPFDDLMLEELVATQLRTEALDAVSRAKNTTTAPKHMHISSKPISKPSISKPPIRAQKRPHALPPKTVAVNEQRNNREQTIPEVRTVHGHRVSIDHSAGNDVSVNQSHTLRQPQTVQQTHTVSTGHTVSAEHTVKQGHTLHQAHTFDQAPSRAARAGALKPVSVAHTINSMPPPAIPIKKPRTISFAPSPVKPDRLRPMAKSISRPLPAVPPSSTQAFLNDHFDDFFPTPSQQVRELDDDINELPSNTQIERELLSDARASSPVLPNKATNEYEMVMCTQDLVMSSQDMLDMDSPCAKQLPPARSPTPPRPAKRKRFFEEKEEDLLEAALHESRILAEREKTAQDHCSGINLRGGEMHEAPSWEEGNTDPDRGHKGPTTSATRKLQRVLSSASDYGEDDFSGCSQELRDAVEGVESSARSSRF